MRMLDAIVSVILAVMAGAVALVVFAVRGLWRGAKRLVGGTRRLVTGEAPAKPEKEKKAKGPKDPREPLEAQDVVVEDVAEERVSYEHLDVDGGASANDVARVLDGLEDDPVVGEYARTANGALRRAEYHKGALFAELGSTFKPNTLSWDKFAGPTEAAYGAVLRNAALLANRCQAFDSSGYQRLGRLARAGALVGDQTRSQRLALLQDVLSSLGTIQEANERLLLELERLSFELGKLTSSDSSEETELVLDEISKLVEEAKYYR